MPIAVSRGRYHTGTPVVLQYGVIPTLARVIEERGPLGVDGRHIYRIRILNGGEDTEAFEMPEDELSPVTLAREDVINYLASGGLIDMLGRNQGGGPNPPRVWLTYSPRRKEPKGWELVVAHTFIAEEGILGGEPIPFFVLTGRKIFEPEKRKVLQFLKSFDLNGADAEDVIRRVGVA